MLPIVRALPADVVSMFRTGEIVGRELFRTASDFIVASLHHGPGSPGTMVIHHLQSIRASVLRASTHEDLHPWVGEGPGLA
jgi:hypothetical protein